mgnify:CR=1 FL=1
MRQRVVGAMAIAAPPRLLIADEPTTSLDLTIQAQYLALLEELQNRHRLAMIFITHNLGIVSRICDRVAVMYAGRIVEAGPVRQIFKSPAHPYTQALLESIPGSGTGATDSPPSRANLPISPDFQVVARSRRGARTLMDRCRARGAAPVHGGAGPGERLLAARAGMTTAASPGAPLLEATRLTKHFAVRRGLLGWSIGLVRAVDSISFRVDAGSHAGARRRSRAAARRRRPSWSSASSGPPRGPSASTARTS